MDEELKCPECRNFFSKPVLFPCSHSVCLECAGNMQESSQQFMSQFEDSSLLQIHEILGETDIFKDFDKLSLVSETDSGVVCNSRPSSYISIGNILPSVHGSSYIVKCPICKKPVFLDESGYKNLPKNNILEAIVEKYCNECKQLQNNTSKCQMCEQLESKEACVMCEQCEIFYCDTCKDICHPSRGPLAKHTLVGPIQGRAILRAKNKASEAKCIEHEEEHLSMYCLFCKLPVCYVCHQEGRHVDHDVQALGVMSKTHKVRKKCPLCHVNKKITWINDMNCMLFFYNS
jgi:tripartite motif-containing protein 9/67